MTITQTTATTYVTSRLGGSPTGMTATQLADMAGRELHNMRSWNWANGTAATADLVASQDYVELPSDFQGFITTPRVTGDQWTWLRPASVQSIDNLRRDQTDPSGSPYYGALTYYVDGSGVAAPRLEVYPTPNTSVTDGLTFYYRRGWASWPDTTTAAKFPGWIDSLYIAVLGAVCRGWEDDLETAGRMQEYLATVAAGTTFNDAVGIDHTLQPSLGEVKGGVGDVWNVTNTTFDGTGAPV